MVTSLMKGLIRLTGLSSVKIRKLRGTPWETVGAPAADIHLTGQVGTIDPAQAHGHLGRDTGGVGFYPGLSPDQYLAIFCRRVCLSRCCRQRARRASCAGAGGDESDAGRALLAAAAAVVAPAD